MGFYTFDQSIRIPKICIYIICAMQIHIETIKWLPTAIEINIDIDIDTVFPLECVRAYVRYRHLNDFNERLNEVNTNVHLSITFFPLEKYLTISFWKNFCFFFKFEHKRFLFRLRLWVVNSVLWTVLWRTFFFHHQNIRY